MNTGASIAIARLRAVASPVRAKANRWFFKTGPGEYGEGDRFFGVTVPQVRSILKGCRSMPLSEIRKLLTSQIHEVRLLGVLILVDQFRRAQDRETRGILHRFYLRHSKRVNNWDLVDASAGYLIGAYLDGKGEGVLKRLAGSSNVWERRMAMLATFHDIICGRPERAFRMAERLLRDPHDLIHKVVGWMLREAGKRGAQRQLERFLRRHASRMPRTMLRYAIERLPESKRRVYLQWK